MKRKVAFFDRDGVINVDIGYLHKPEDLVWVDGVSDAIRLLNEEGFEVFVVTNQAGIGRGFYSEEQFLRLTHWIESELKAKGAEISRTLYCPHHPTEAIDPYLVDCECRKPKPGMLTEVLKNGEYDLEQSFLIGDSLTDLEAAKAAGVDAFHFTGGNLLEFVQRILAAQRYGPELQ